MSRKLRWPVVAVCVLIVAWLSYDMWQLNLAERTWGHRPLFLFAAFWTAVVLSVYPATAKDPNSDRWLLLSTLSGFLLALGFPPLPLTGLLFVGFVPLLLVEYQLRNSRSGTSVKAVFRYALNTFVIWNILATFWVANTAFVAGIVANFLNALFMTVPILFYHLLSRHFPKFTIGIFAAFWLSFEMLHLNWEITWPWLNLGNAFGRFPEWVQFYEFTGALGGSLWVVVVNGLLLRLITKRRLTGRWPRPQMMSVALAILVPLAGSYLWYTLYQETGPEREIVIVQPNYEPHYVRPRTTNDQLLRDAGELSTAALTPQTDYLLFPESAFGRVDSARIGQDRRTGPLRQILGKYPNLNLITGVSSQHILAPDDPDTRAVRYDTDRNGREVRWEAYNAAAQLNNRSEAVQLHLKDKLVPGAEFMPYRRVFSFLEPLADKLGGSLAGYGRYEQPTVFHSEAGRVAPVICYESVYGEYVTRYLASGKEAQAIFIMTKDGWWDLTPGHLQHLHYARLRAIETRRDVARSANTGISSIINQRGDIVQRTRYNERTTLSGTIRLNDQRTFYAQWGDMTGRIAVYTALLLLLQLAFKTWQERVNRKKQAQA